MNINQNSDGDECKWVDESENGQNRQETPTPVNLGTGQLDDDKQIDHDDG